MSGQDRVSPFSRKPSRLAQELPGSATTCLSRGIPCLPDECRGLPGPHQPEVQGQLKNAGGVLINIVERGLGCQRQGSRSRRPEHKGHAAGRDCIEIIRTAGGSLEGWPRRPLKPLTEGLFLPIGDYGRYLLILQGTHTESPGRRPL